MTIRKLGAADIDLLVKLRVDFTLNEKVGFTGQELDLFREKCEEYFISAFKAGNFTAFAAEEDGEKLYDKLGFRKICCAPMRKELFF